MDRKAAIACLAAASIAAGVVVSTVVTSRNNQRTATQASPATVTVTTTVTPPPTAAPPTSAPASESTPPASTSQAPATETSTKNPQSTPQPTPNTPDKKPDDQANQNPGDRPNQKPVDKSQKSPSSFNYILPRGGSYARTHHNYPASDIFAPCGAKFLSPVDGVVSAVSTKDVWKRKTNRGPERGGLSITIDAGAVRYYGSHEAKVFVKRGDRVRRGQIIGTVGETGSAKGTGCHIHFGLSPTACPVDSWWIRRGTIYPWPYLDAWKAGDFTSRKADPTQKVLEWHRKNGCPTKPGRYK